MARVPDVCTLGESRVSGRCVAECDILSNICGELWKGIAGFDMGKGPVDSTGAVLSAAEDTFSGGCPSNGAAVAAAVVP